MTRDILMQILDLARWAPSGDNTQPWRFELVSDNHIAIHGHDTRDHVLYDFDGHASHMAHGALLETLRLAATRFGLKAEWNIRPDQPDTAPIYDVILHPAGIPEDPLVSCIPTRTVQRRPMSTTPLLQAQKEALIAAVGEDYTLQFFESFEDRLAVARLLWNNAYIRLTCPEAYPVHRDIIEWDAQYSADRIPDQAVGTDPLTTRLMRWVMRSWDRVDFFNRFLMGTIIPRVELDFVPAVLCAAHILLRPNQAPTTLRHHVHAGIALQRLWLTACKHGLYLQPEMTPLIFREYVRASRSISRRPDIQRRMKGLVENIHALTETTQRTPLAFFCRVGRCQQPISRSLRKEASDLLRTYPE